MKRPPGDVGVRHAVGEQLEDLPLARRQHVGLVLAGEERGHQRRVDVTVALRDLLDRAHERLVRRLLEDVALRAGLEPAAEQRALGVGGEDQDLRAGHALGQQLRRLEAVHPRHADVHDDHVGLAPLRELDRGRAVGGLADDADVRRPREREPQSFAHDLVVVDDQRGDLVCHVGASYAEIRRDSCSGFGGGRSGSGRRSRIPWARASLRTSSRAGAVSFAGR